MASGQEWKFMFEIYYKYYVKRCIYIKLLGVVQKVDDLTPKLYHLN